MAALTSGVIMAEDPLSGLNRLAYIWGQLDAGHVMGENWLGVLGIALVFLAARLAEWGLSELYPKLPI